MIDWSLLRRQNFAGESIKNFRLIYDETSLLAYFPGGLGIIMSQIFFAGSLSKITLTRNVQFGIEKTEVLDRFISKILSSGE